MLATWLVASTEVIVLLLADELLFANELSRAVGGGIEGDEDEHVMDEAADAIVC